MENAELNSTLALKGELMSLQVYTLLPIPPCFHKDDLRLNVNATLIFKGVPLFQVSIFSHITTRNLNIQLQILCDIPTQIITKL